MDYLAPLVTLVGVYALLGLSLNLALGGGGFLSLGHVAFFALGAYASALTSLHAPALGWATAALAAGAVAVLAASLLVLATAKLRGDYLALATLSFHFVTISLLNNAVPLTRGPAGLSGVPRPAFFESDPAFALLVATFALATWFGFRGLLRGSWGLRLRAFRDDPVFAESLGVRPIAVKLESMALSAFVTGVAGAIAASQYGFISPASFPVDETVLVLTIVLLGGLGSMTGSLAAAAILLLLPEALRFLPLPADSLGPLRQILVAFVLLFILLVRPRGLYGRVDLRRD